MNGVVVEDLVPRDEPAPPPRRELVDLRETVLGRRSAREAARRCGISRSALGRIERGETRGIGHYVAALAKVYGCTVDDIEAVEQRYQQRLKLAKVGESFSWDLAGAAAASRAAVGFDLATGSLAPDDPLVLDEVRQLQIAPTVPDTAHAGAFVVYGEVVDALADVSLELRRLAQRQPSSELLVAVRGRLRLLLHQLAGTYTIDVGRRLHGLLSQLNALCGWLAYDTDRHGLAFAHWRAGLRTAAAIGERSSAACFVSNLSLLAGTRQMGLAVAQQAEQLLGAGGSHRVRALVVSRQARHAAGLGDAMLCASCLGRVEQLLDAADADTSEAAEPGWLTAFDRAAALLEAGACRLMLGDVAHASEELRRVLSLLPMDDLRGKALALARLARVQLAQAPADVPAAVAAATKSLAITVGRLDSVAVAEELRAVGEALVGYEGGEPGMEELRGAIGHWVVHEQDEACIQLRPDAATKNAGSRPLR